MIQWVRLRNGSVITFVDIAPGKEEKMSGLRYNEVTGTFETDTTHYLSEDEAAAAFIAVGLAGQAQRLVEKLKELDIVLCRVMSTDGSLPPLED